MLTDVLSVPSSTIKLLHSDERMPQAANLVTLICLVLAVDTTGAQAAPSAIRGMLGENGTPIVEATVFLQSFDDARCAKLFTSKKGNSRSVQKLRLCMHDVSTTTPDAHGIYQFSAPKAGWYVVHFLWSTGKTPSQSPSLFKEGRWVVVYAGHKDSTGKYDTMAQDSPFYFSAKEDVIRDFHTRR